MRPDAPTMNLRAGEIRGGGGNFFFFWAHTHIQNNRLKTGIGVSVLFKSWHVGEKLKMRKKRGQDRERHVNRPSHEACACRVRRMTSAMIKNVAIYGLKNSFCRTVCRGRPAWESGFLKHLARLWFRAFISWVSVRDLFAFSCG